MNEALNQVAKSPFTRRIEGASLPRRFNQPTFSLYNGQTDPVEHVSHFNQKMAVHSKDEALMCKIFPSSLGPMAMRWFNGLRANFIDSFKKLTQSFGARFITCSRVSNKKCVYIIKKRAYVYICVCGSCLDKFISVALGPPNKNSWLRP